MRPLSSAGIVEQSSSRHKNQLMRLENAHRSLAEELEQLTRRAHLTPTEIERTAFLKKQKLQTKDKIRVLMSRVL
jgi:uncharacterized protein YdcH (DUF465 family)